MSVSPAPVAEPAPDQPPVDLDARKRVRTALDANLCVEAGAGTGKTTALVSRVVALLVRGAATVDDLAVITFTEKAAIELSTRVRQGLEDARAAANAGSAERERADSALATLYRGRIQTIHSFAADLLRERPIDAQLDPRFELLDELQADVRFDEAYRRWVDELLAEPRPEVERALRRGFEPKDLRRLAEELHRQRDALPLAPVDEPRADLDTFRARVATWAASLAELISDCLAEEDRALCNAREVARFLDDARVADDDELIRIVLFEAPVESLHLGRANAWNPPESCKAVKELLKEYKCAVEELRRVLREQALCGLLPLAQAFVGDETARRRRDAQATFDDLLIWARDLVRDDRYARAHFAARSPRILVDEFQDTDPVQAELIAHLCAAPGADHGDWTTLALRPGSLFVVGDPKQSIYRFRRADIAVYDRVKDGLLGGRVERLRENFRSSDRLIAWLNRAFDALLVPEPGVQPANTPLHARATLGAEIDRPTVVAVSRTPDEEGGPRGAEALAVAGALEAAVAGPEPWPIRDPATREIRPARFGDVAILTPTRTGLNLLERALEERRIPYRLEGGRSLYARREVREVVALLHAIDDPLDQISLVATLRSLAYGCSDEQLLRWHAAAGRFDVRRAFDTGNGVNAAVRDALAELDDIGRARRGLSLGELVRAALERTRMVETALTLPGGAQLAANMLRLVDEARSFGAGGGGLRAFTGWLARKRDDEPVALEAPVGEEHDPLVRVLTIHAAKGLEFPIVALFNVNERASGWFASVADASAHRVHLRLREFTTPGWDEARQAEQAALDAERTRLAYVAATRARDHLVVPVCRAPGRRDAGYLALMAGVLGAGEEPAGDVIAIDGDAFDPPVGATELDATTPDAREVDTVARRRTVWLEEQERLARSSRGGLAIATPSELESAARPLASEADVRLGELDDQGGLGTEEAPPLALGDAFHRVLALVDLPRGEDVQVLAGALCAEAGIPAWERELVELARRTLATDVVVRACAAGRMWRELPVVCGPGVVPGADAVVGRVDLVFEAGDGLVLVDYKTDRVAAGDEGVVARSHAAQLDAYAAALEAATGTPVRERVVVFARTGAAVAV